MTLVELFEYDAWANRLWLTALETNGVEVEWEVFRHLLSAQKIWLLRLSGVNPAAMPEIEDFRTELEDLHQGWLQAIHSHRHNPVINYQRTNGDRHSKAFESVAHHVVNHGTYHRGEIRGLYRARGCDEFPETDLIAFLM